VIPECCSGFYGDMWARILQIEELVFRVVFFTIWCVQSLFISSVKMAKYAEDLDTKSSLRDPYDLVTRCAVCSQLYNDPVLLHCLHTFCANCLRGRSTRNGDSESVAAAPSESVNNVVICPLCRVPSYDSLESLPANSFAAKIAGVRRLDVRRGTEQLACSACQRSAQPCPSLPRTTTTTSVVYCVDCDDTLCIACSDAHRKLKITEPHHLVKLSDNNFTDKVMMLKSMLTPPCHLHPNQLRTLYCRETGCLQPICPCCALKEHRKHNFVDISELTGSQRATLTSSVETIVAASRHVMNDRERVRIAIDRLNASLRKTTQGIADKAAELNEVVAKKRQDLQGIVNYVQLEQMTKADEVEDKVQRAKQVTENVMAVCRELASRGSDVEVCSLAPKYVDRARQLLDSSDIQLPKPVQFTFMPNSDLETMYGSQPDKLFGTVSLRHCGDCNEKL